MLSKVGGGLDQQLLIDVKACKPSRRTQSVEDGQSDPASTADL
jgi:hypothetical protein